MAVNEVQEVSFGSEYWMVCKIEEAGKLARILHYS